MLIKTNRIETAVPVAISVALPPPEGFHEQYIATRSTPYSFIQSPQQPSSSGGVLRGGQAVWLRQVVQRKRLSSSVHAFVENVGFVLLDPRMIKKGDGTILPS